VDQLLITLEWSDTAVKRILNDIASESASLPVQDNAHAAMHGSGNKVPNKRQLKGSNIGCSSDSELEGQQLPAGSDDDELWNYVWRLVEGGTQDQTHEEPATKRRTALSFPPVSTSLPPECLYVSRDKGVKRFLNPAIGWGEALVVAPVNQHR
ncbi:unnamed protein product, partial [Symbiodinium sp. KB8]